MDDMRFDLWTRRLDTRLSRRGLSGVAAGALAALGLASASDAKKKKRKKKKKKKTPSPTVSYSCGNLGTACGNTAVCQCRLNKSSKQVCMNVVTPPNGINFPPCQTNANCGSGQFCDLQFSQCTLACRN
jgi:hypothetical protein